MNQEHQFQFPLRNGLHARPASHLQEVTNRFRSVIVLANHRTGREADAKSVLALVGADVKFEDSCSLLFSGDDATAACQALTSYLQNEFLSCDEALPEVQVPAIERSISRSLRAAGLEKFHTGITLSPGIARGHVFVVGGLTLPESLRSAVVSNPSREWEIFGSAVLAVCDRIQNGIDQSSRIQESEVLKVHLSIVQDKRFGCGIHERLAGGSLTAGQAIMAEGDLLCETLRNAENRYLRERVLDIQDVCSQLLLEIYGAEAEGEKLRLMRPSVCVANNLTPSQFLALDRRWLKGLILGDAGSTSHTVILARSFGIPTMVGSAEASVLLRPGQEVIVDADRGIVIPEVTEQIDCYYRRELAKAARLHAKLSAYQNRQAVTSDGRRLEIAANIASADEAVSALEAGAEGIGLFRTEMLFMDREAPPSEEEQTAIYTAVAKAVGISSSAIIRMLDAGGDKPVAYLGLAKEANPFLGYRGVRIYEEFADIIKTQLRAILRAAEHGNVRVMIPMVSSVEEVRQVKRLLADAREELRLVGATAADSKIELGIMLEVPSVAFQMPQLCQEVDFFSIGTNDLLQYSLAVDRDNRKVASIYSAFHPAVLRLIDALVKEAHGENKWIGLCGQAGEDARLLPLLIGLGVDEISLSAPQIPSIKAAVCRASFAECAALLTRVLRSTTRDEAAAHLNAFHAARESMPILTPELVVLDTDAATKAEAIKELTDALDLAGRTDDPERLEEEIWQREDAYSTGFGGGFAIPHCKSAHLAANSIVILKTKPDSSGISWGSLDGKPVRIAILLAIRDDNGSKEHLKVLAKLSRQVMRDAFRERLLSETDPAALTSFVLDGLYV